MLEFELQLGEELGEEPALREHREHQAGVAFHQAPGEFLPRALGHQGVGFAVCDHGAHQRHGFGRDLESEARGEARDAQDPHRILDKSGAYVPQQPALEVGCAAERIDEAPGLVARHGVDGQIPPLEILLERDFG